MDVIPDFRPVKPISKNPGIVNFGQQPIDGLILKVLATDSGTKIRVKKIQII